VRVLPRKAEAHNWPRQHLPQLRLAPQRRLQVHPAAAAPEGQPEIPPIHADANSKRVAGERWHSDVSCDPEPPMGSILHLRTVPPTGGDTLFASAYAAYDALSARMKAYLDGMTATHDGEQVYRGRYADQGVDDTGKATRRPSTRSSRATRSPAASSCSSTRPSPPA
jgi:taurine dioxygenase